jgi:tetratricopeptide (TPR) repeat protein
MMKRIFGRRRMTSVEAAALYRDGLAAFEAADYETAISQLSQIDDSCSLSSTLAKFYLGQSHLKFGVVQLNAGRHAVAIEHFNSARRLNPDAAGLSRYLAACYAAQRNFDLAANELEHTPDSDVDAGTRAIRLAHALARDGRAEEAAESLVKALEAEPFRNDIRKQLGLLYAATEDYLDAVCVFQEAVELAPLDADVRTCFGLALAASEDHAEAAEQLAVAHRLRPNDAYLGMLLAHALDAAKTTRVKLRIDHATNTLVPTDECSLDALSELVASEPDFIEAFLNLPRTGMDEALFSLVAGVLERALSRNPEYADLHYHCARVYERLGREDDAIDAARKAVSLNPRYVQALIQLGRMYAAQDETLEARERLSEAILFGGDYPDVHFLIGEMYRRDGDQPSAADAYRRALEINKDYDRARIALAEMVGGA